VLNSTRSVEVLEIPFERVGAISIFVGSESGILFCYYALGYTDTIKNLILNALYYYSLQGV
jgi:hypothetical protein